MNFKKIMGLFAFLLVIGIPAIGQANFQQTIMDKYDLDYNYTSMVRMEDATGRLTGYVIAGTRFNKQPTSNVSDFVLMTYDVNGNLIKNLKFDNFEKEVCLDVVMGSNNTAVITGFVEFPNGRRMTALIQVHPTTGVVVASKLFILSDGNSSMGTTIAYDKNKDEYVLGGISIRNPKVINSGAEGYYMILRNDFDKRHIAKFKGNTITGLTAPNQIVITPNSDIFITGTFMIDAINQGMAAFMLNSSGSVKWDLSYSSSGEIHMGVDAVYEPGGNGTIYLVGNHSRDHNFLVTTIRNANSPSAYISNEYMLDIHNTSLADNPIALGVEFSATNSNNLVVMGMFTKAPYAVTGDHSPLYVSEFNKFSGTPVNTQLYQVASTGYNNTHGLLLSPFWAWSSADCMYSPSAFVVNDDGGYSFVGHRKLSTKAWNVEMYKTRDDLTIGNKCNYRLYPKLVGFVRPRVNYSLKFTGVNVKPYNVGKDWRGFSTSIEMNCPTGGEKAQLETTIEDSKFDTQSLSIYPNPSNLGTFTVQLDGFTANKNVIIYNSLGNIVYETATAVNRIVVETTDFAPGIYFVQVTDEKNSKMEKVIIQ